MRITLLSNQPRRQRKDSSNNYIWQWRDILQKKLCFGICAKWFTAKWHCAYRIDLHKKLTTKWLDQIKLCQLKGHWMTFPSMEVDRQWNGIMKMIKTKTRDDNEITYTYISTKLYATQRHLAKCHKVAF
jgi:hypothetical protein